jgi:hypothetical protein
MEREKKYFGGWFIWLLFFTVLGCIVLGSLSYMGLIGHTVVERIVFENSFQYKEARNNEFIIFKAQLVEIEHKLAGSNINTLTRANLEAQAAGIRIQMSTIQTK